VDADLFGAINRFVDIVDRKNATIVLLKDGEVCSCCVQKLGEPSIPFTRGPMALGAAVPVFKFAEAFSLRIL
jgi:hypothetical protein